MTLSKTALRFGAVCVVTLTVVPAALIALRSYRQQSAVFFPERRPVGVSKAAAKLDGVLDASFGADGATLRGWYVPSKNRAAVIFVHGSGGDRASLLYEARLLANRGYGVLAYDLPGHGESGGEIRWAEPERASLRAALTWLAARPEVDGLRIGALGFSLGGYVVAQVAATDERVRAVVLSGTPADPVEQVRFQHRRFSWLTQAPALWVLFRGGMDLKLRAVDYVDKLAPRPLLVIHGSEDATVPSVMAEQLFARAQQPKELLLLQGAGHGHFDPFPEYGLRLTTFFDRALAP